MDGGRPGSGGNGKAAVRVTFSPGVEEVIAAAAGSSSPAEDDEDGDGSESHDDGDGRANAARERKQHKGHCVRTPLLNCAL